MEGSFQSNKMGIGKIATEMKDVSLKKISGCGIAK